MQHRHISNHLSPLSTPQLCPPVSNPPLCPDHVFQAPNHDPLSTIQQLEATLKQLPTHVAVNDNTSHRSRRYAFISSARHACLAHVLRTLARAQFSRSLRQQRAVGRAVAAISNTDWWEGALKEAGPDVRVMIAHHREDTWRWGVGPMDHVDGQEHVIGGHSVGTTAWSFELTGRGAARLENEGFGEWVRKVCGNLLRSCTGWLRELAEVAGESIVGSAGVTAAFCSTPYAASI